MNLTGNAWLLCTRTADEDYLWVGKASEPTDLYRRVADETDHRCGYFLYDGHKMEVGLNRLDADRRDNGNRRIRHSLILSAKADGEEAEFLRKLFAQAIADTTPMASDSVAAELARRLFAWWEANTDPSRTADCPDWWIFAKDLADGFPEASNVEPLTPGCYYRRTPEILAHLGVSAKNRTPILLLGAATNHSPDIWPVRGYEGLPAILCSLEPGADGELLSTHMARQRTASQPPTHADEVNQGYRQLQRRFPWLPKLLLVLGAAIALALAWSLLAGKAERQDERAAVGTPASQPIPEQAAPTGQAMAEVSQTGHVNQTPLASPPATPPSNTTPDNIKQGRSSP